ncbi:MAG TPA: acyltransferase [Actinomycetes bacterium]|nr:acyltransferase [Actinomycetes bacterium]
MTTLTYDEYRARRRIDVLDGLRAISIVLVMTAHPAYRHVWPAFHGKTGVTIFFVLSGYLITTLALREEQTSGRLDLAGFYVRRVFRIYPLYLAILALYAILILGLHQQPDRRAAFVSNIPEYLLFLPEHAVFFPYHGHTAPFDGSWSLGIEEKFYFFWPLLGFVLLAHRFRGRLLFLSIVAALFFVVPWTIHGQWGLALESYVHIALGCIVALLLHNRRTYDALRRLGEPLPLALAIVVVVVAQFSTNAVENGGYLYSVFGLLILPAFVGCVVTNTRVAAALTLGPMLFLGRISYALYLTHNFGLNFSEAHFPHTPFGGFSRSLVTTFVGLSLGVLMAYAMHRAIELPFLRVGRRITGHGTGQAPIRPADRSAADSAEDEARIRATRGGRHARRPRAEGALATEPLPQAEITRG